LLSLSVTRLDPIDAVTTDHVRSLILGDRTALLLHLRRLTLGNRIQCRLRCPDAGCAEELDLDLDTDELLVPAYGYDAAKLDAEFTKDGRTSVLKYRLPTGADQEEAAELALSDPDEAVRQLLQKCVLEINENGKSGGSGFSQDALDRLQEEMAERDPQNNIKLKMHCPSCRSNFTIDFPVWSFILEEMLDLARRLERDVHFLAYHYHWSESEILDMKTTKRRRYQDLLLETLPARSIA
jgi:hypothetical protein